MRTAWFGILILACASCAHDEDAVAPQPAKGGLSAAERAEVLEWAKKGERKEVTWEQAVDASTKMERKLEALFNSFGFKRNESYEEHPTEAFSYTHVYTSASAHAMTATFIEEELRKVSPLFKGEWGGKGWFSLSLDTPYPTPKIEQKTDLIGAVSVAAHGTKVYDRDEDKPFVAISVFHVLYFPEDLLNKTSFDFLRGKKPQRTWSNRGEEWAEYFLGEEDIEAVATRVRKELLSMAFLEVPTSMPLYQFRKGTMEVIIVSSSVVKLIDAPLGQEVVFIVDEAGNARKSPVVLVKVGG